MADTPSTEEPRLQRSIGAGMLALYGLGTMLGVGIYGLVGRAAGMLGGAVWAAFLVAMAAALLTGLSYAALGARYPRAGGAAYIIERAYRRRVIAYTAGLAVIASGLTSMATGARIFGDNLDALFDFGAPVELYAAGYLLVLCVLVWRGLRESLWVNALCTLVEAAGLILLIVLGARFWGQADLMELPSEQNWGATGLLLAQSAVLTFFAFLGFEDTLNVAEEVKNPARNVPLGIIGAMLAATILYMLVAVTAVSVVPWRDLAEAPAPLGAVMERAAPWLPSIVYSGVTIFAVANTSLINFVMASRLTYGLARQGFLPKPLMRIHPKRHTPHVAAIAIFAAATLLVFAGDVSQLAAATVLLLLAVFALMNGAQLLLANRAGEPRAPIRLPSLVPALGGLICLGLLGARALGGEIRAPLIALALIGGILLLYFATRATHRPDATPSEEAAT